MKNVEISVKNGQLENHVILKLEGKPSDIIIMLHKIMVAHPPVLAILSVAIATFEEGGYKSTVVTDFNSNINNQQ